MLYHSTEMEEQAVLQAAALMCAAARTAPKTKGIDTIHTLILTGADKEQLADRMRELGRREFGENSSAWYDRDSENLRNAQAVILIGAEPRYRQVRQCGFCGFKDCADCAANGGSCAFTFVDLGIAVSSAASIAAQLHIDSRIMYSVGKAAGEMDYGKNIRWLGMPLSVSGKNIFFDR